MKVTIESVTAESTINGWVIVCIMQEGGYRYRSNYCAATYDEMVSIFETLWQADGKMKGQKGYPSAKGRPL